MGTLDVNESNYFWGEGWGGRICLRARNRFYSSLSRDFATFVDALTFPFFHLPVLEMRLEDS